MKLLIFDCDGTIVDSQAGIVLSMEHAFKALGMTPPTREKTLSVVGLSLPEAFSVLVPEAHYDTRIEIAERYKNAFRELNHDPADSEILFPGCRNAIEALKARDDVVLGIATGKSRRGVDRLLEREGWKAHFVTIQTADDHPSKPDPSMVTRAMSETGATAHQTVMIGDTSFDIEMGRAAGVGALGVTWGYHARHDLESAGAHAVVHSYTELSRAIDDVLAHIGQVDA